MLHGAGLKGPWCWHSWSISWDSATGSSIPRSPSWSQASCRAGCCAKKSMFHCIGYKTLFDDLLCCRTQDCAALSVGHWSTKRQSHLGRKSSSLCQCSVGLQGRVGGGRPGLPSPTSPLQQRDLPCQPSRAFWGHPQTWQCRIRQEEHMGTPEFLCCSLRNWCTHPSV